MTMHNLPHPGEVIREAILEPYSLTDRQLASKWDVSPSALIRILQRRSGFSPEMALRLSKVLGRSPESWLAMQDNHELRRVRQSIDLASIEKVEFPATWYQD